MIVADLMSRILSVTKQDETLLDVDVRPLRPAYLFLTHYRGNRIARDAPHRDHLACLKIVDEFVDFFLCRPTVAFDAFAHKVEVFQSNSR